MKILRLKLLNERPEEDQIIAAFRDLPFYDHDSDEQEISLLQDPINWPRTLSSLHAAAHAVNLVWFATYGPNMNYKAFLCYIGGGKAEYMKQAEEGCRDKAPPLANKWKMVPHHRLFFGFNDNTRNKGGLAFLDFVTNKSKRAYVRMYLITSMIFLLQLNNRILFNLTDIVSVKEQNHLTVGPLTGAYNNVMYLGTERDMPILTLTCSPSARKKLKSKWVYPLNKPSKAYKQKMVKALVEGKQMSEKGAEEYVNKAYKEPL
ncbi:Histone deacetylase 5 [Sesamum angolense]|uniref:Histone deacetylase 5 n=1 Tax=Sesamum angolense TaxID=2727404 RepID=A0AAE2BS82_9LAMI|nr:Histone deacetylase 5 [Sesamum angolense]